MHKIFYEIVFLIILLFNLCFAQVEIADHFLEISPNARASAMGESGVGLADDVWAIFWNSAGYAFQQGSEVAITYAHWPIYSFPNYSINYISFKQPVKKLGGVIAGSITYENFGNYVEPQFGPVMSSSLRIHEMAFALGYSAKLLPTMGLGFNARYFFSNYDDPGSGIEESPSFTGCSFDIGLMYRPESCLVPFTGVDLGKNLSLGFNLSNIGPNIFYIDRSRKSPIPQNLCIGFALTCLQLKEHSLTWTMDFNRLLIHKDTKTYVADEFYKAFYTTWTDGSFSDQLNRFRTSIGIEYWYGSPKLFAIRIGYFYQDLNQGGRKSITFGSGIRYEFFGFDFSYANVRENKDLSSEEVRFTLLIGL